MKLKKFLQAFGLVAVLFTLIPFIAADYWWIRLFDFPHTQLTILTFVAFVTYFIKFDIKQVKDYVFVSVLAACLIYQLFKILPFLPHENFEMEETAEGSSAPRIKFLIANVLQKNEEPQKLFKEVKEKDADVLLFMETDTRWMNDIRTVVKDYPHRLEIPLGNTYGMLLYSKFPLIDEKIRFLVDDSIPSIEAILHLPSGEKVQTYFIHPTPPMPQHNPSSSDRDAEMMLVAKAANKSPLPVIIAGDFNDVAWSQSTLLFKNVSGLLDPRVGRGFYNTFNAKSYIMRWPLDHFFASDDFRLAILKLGNDIDSDHFPAYFEVTLEPEVAQEQNQPAPTVKQMEKADKQIEKSRKEQVEKKVEEAKESN